MTQSKHLQGSGTILHLTLKKKWFDMIATGEKKAEYRAIKPYWTNRLFNHLDDTLEPKCFDKVIFKNGYSSDAPTLVIECVGIKIGLGTMRWGAEPGVEYYIIELGHILFHSNT